MIDAAKGIAILPANGGDIPDYAEVDKATMILPLVVLPSTSHRGRRVPVLHRHRHYPQHSKITILGRALCLISSSTRKLAHHRCPNGSMLTAWMP